MFDKDTDSRRQFVLKLRDNMRPTMSKQALDQRCRVKIIAVLVVLVLCGLDWSVIVASNDIGFTRV